MSADRDEPVGHDAGHLDDQVGGHADPDDLTAPDGAVSVDGDGTAVDHDEDYKGYVDGDLLDGDPLDGPEVLPITLIVLGLTLLTFTILWR